MITLKEFNLHITPHLLFHDSVKKIKIQINLRFLSRFIPNFNLSMNLTT